MGGGTTSFIQANDTHLHRHLNNHYRKAEIALMLEKAFPSSVLFQLFCNDYLNAGEGGYHLLFNSWELNQNSSHMTHPFSFQ